MTIPDGNEALVETNGKNKKSKNHKNVGLMGPLETASFSLSHGFFKLRHKGFHRGKLQSLPGPLTLSSQ